MIVINHWIRLARFLQPLRPINSLVLTTCRLRPSLKVPLRVDPHIIIRDEAIVYAYSTDLHIRRSTMLSLALTMNIQAKILDLTTYISYTCINSTW